MALTACVSSEDFALTIAICFGQGMMMQSTALMGFSLPMSTTRQCTCPYSPVPFHGEWATHVMCAESSAEPGIVLPEAVELLDLCADGALQTLSLVQHNYAPKPGNTASMLQFLEPARLVPSKPGSSVSQGTGSANWCQLAL